jgi:hypothetical protein
MAGLNAARQFALSLPGTTEEPHHEMSSFRVGGKIFATVTPDEQWLHVFVVEPEISASVAEDPAAFQPLIWGKAVRGVRVHLAAARQDRLAELLAESWRRKASRRLIAEHDAGNGTT